MQPSLTAAHEHGPGAPASGAPARPPRRTVWIALLIAGVAVRLFLWWFTVGTNDVATWASHGQNVGARGLAETYRTERLYNHPPLIGLFAAWAVEASGGLTLPFARLIKLPSMLGEAVALAALWRWGGVRLAAIYALLPAPILVAAYHGNTDCLYAAFALLAALAWERRRFALAGLALAAALNVKLIPLVLLPLYVIGAPSASALLRFGATLALAFVPYVAPLLEAAPAMYRNMVAYNSSADEWGLLALLNPAVRSEALRPFVEPLRDGFLAVGRYLILGGITAIAIAARRRPSWSMLERVALAAALFLVLAPGFGVQYVVFPAAVLVATDVRAGIVWGVASGLFIGALYVAFLLPMDLWCSRFAAPFPVFPTVLGFVAWAALAYWTAARIIGRIAQPRDPARQPAAHPS